MNSTHPIVRWLARQGLSQAWLAREAGVSDSLLSKYLTGRVGISMETAAALRDATGLSLDAICEQREHGRGSISRSMGEGMTAKRARKGGGR